MSVGIIGGGKNALEHFQSIKPDIIIGCNHHWRKYHIVPDYMVYIDKDSSEIKRALFHFNGKTVSLITNEADIQLKYNRMHPYVRRKLTGLIAIWFALNYINGKIYLCGYDNYEGSLKHKLIEEKFMYIFKHPERDRIIWLQK